VVVVRRADPGENGVVVGSGRRLCRTTVGSMTEWARERFARAPVARLATVTPDGRPHLVPVTFAVSQDVLWTAVDGKPKQTRRLQRLANIEASPQVSLLVDHYEDDWSALWWVRADGDAHVAVPGAAEERQGLELLAAKYPPYRSQPPGGPVVVVHLATWRSWTAARVEAPARRVGERA
jgi:PPOX class probable F420-dependent enzyme